MQCLAYRIQPGLNEVEQSIRRLNASLNEYYESRQMVAVNRLAILSLVFGCGAVLTGFFGMNFGGLFRSHFFENQTWPQTFAVSFVAFATVAAFGYAAYLIVLNWKDYRDAANPRRNRRLCADQSRFRRLRPRQDHRSRAQEPLGRLVLARQSHLGFEPGHKYGHTLSGDG